jgi:hypothetical protein
LTGSGAVNAARAARLAKFDATARRWSPTRNNARAFVLRYQIDETLDEIDVELSADTTGWIGFGYSKGVASQSSSHENCDVV